MKALEALEFGYDALGKSLSTTAAVDQQFVDEPLNPILVAPALRKPVREVRMMATQLLRMNSRRHSTQPQVSVAEQNSVYGFRRHAQ